MKMHDFPWKLKPHGDGPHGNIWVEKLVNFIQDHEYLETSVWYVSYIDSKFGYELFGFPLYIFLLGDQNKKFIDHLSFFHAIIE